DRGSLYRRHSAAWHERERRVLRDQHRHRERAGVGRCGRCCRLLIHDCAYRGMAGSGQPLPAIVLIGRDILDISILVMLQKAVAYVSMALLAGAAYSDIKTFRIPNLLVGAIAVVGVIRLVLLHDPL